MISYLRNLLRIALSAMLIFVAGQAQATPESGWWWNPAEGGRGFTIEVQNGVMFMAGYMYDEAGKATWYVSGPTPMVSNSVYQGKWQLYGGGQTLNSAYKGPSVVNANAGYVTVNFSSPTSATMVMPNGVTIPISRYSFGTAGSNTGTVTNACDPSNFTYAKFNAITVGMTLDQVKLTIGCTNDPTITSRISNFVGLGWKARVPNSLLSYFIWVYFDSTGAIVTDMASGGAPPYFKSSTGF